MKPVIISRGVTGDEASGAHAKRRDCHFRETTPTPGFIYIKADVSALWQGGKTTCSSSTEHNSVIKMTTKSMGKFIKAKITFTKRTCSF